MGWLTMDTLRPRPACCRQVGCLTWDRSVVVKKTHLGQGLFALESTAGELRRRGPAVPGRGHRTDAGEKGCSSTRVNMDHDSGEAAKTRSGQPAMQMADGRVVKLRPSCLKSYAAGMGRRSEGMGHSNRRIERSKRRTHSGLCGNIPLGRPLGEPSSIPLVCPGLRERTPRFLRQRNTGKT